MEHWFTIGWSRSDILEGGKGERLQIEVYRDIFYKSADQKQMRPSENEWFNYYLGLAPFHDSYRAIQKIRES